MDSNRHLRIRHGERSTELLRRKIRCFRFYCSGIAPTVGLRPGWIICLDDVDRLSEKVGFENFLGYVTELRDKWQLKVVLIFNREPIDKDAKSHFTSMRKR